MERMEIEHDNLRARWERVKRFRDDDPERFVDLEAATRSFLSDFMVVAVDEPIAERAVSLRRDHRIKLPDAVIWATAQVHALLLVTRNTKDFPLGDPGVRAPYRL